MSSPCTRPIDSGTLRCGQASASAAYLPLSPRKIATSSPRIVVAYGEEPISRSQAAAYHALRRNIAGMVVGSVLDTLERCVGDQHVARRSPGDVGGHRAEQSRRTLHAPIADDDHARLEPLGLFAQRGRRVLQTDRAGDGGS